MRVVRDRWGEKWVRRYPDNGIRHTHERFEWSSPTHVFTYVRQLGRIPTIGDVDG